MQITEDWVRGLTGWKPFKEGKALADQGLVAHFKRSGDIFQGSLSEGRLKLRPVVKIAGPSDVRVQCSCPEHRAGGGVCAHAVAVLLTSLRGAPAPAAGPVTSRPPTQTPATAWRAILSPRFATELAEGKLSFRLLPAEAPPSTADHRLHEWLAARKLPPAGPHALRIAGADCAGLLDTLAGHPRVEIEGRNAAFAITTEPAPPLCLADSRLEGTHVVLELARNEPRRPLVRWGNSPARIGDNSLQQLPARSAGAAWLDQAITLAAGGRLKVPLVDFLAEFDAWLDLFESPPPGWLGSLRLAGAEPGFELELDGSLDLLRARLLVHYAGLSARPIPDPGEAIPGLPRIAPDGHLIARHHHAEDQALRRLRALGFEPLGAARFQLRGRDAILDLMANGLPEIRRAWTVKDGPEFRQTASRVHIVRPEIRENTGQGGALGFELAFQTDSNRNLPLAELRRLLRGKRSARLANGAELVVSRSYEEWVDPLLDELGFGHHTAPFEASGAQAIAIQHLREKLHNSLSFSSFSDLKNLPERDFSNVGLKATLRAYQATGASWLIERLSTLRGALLADEMGLGKTIQTIAAILHFKQQNNTPTLVVAPTSLLGNWMHELKHFAPTLKTLLFHGTDRDRKRDLAKSADVIVTSYGTLARDLAFHLQSHYRLVVADEASLLRNPEADISRALCKIPAEARLALSGTPVENRPQDLWSIFRFVAPGYLGARAEFKERYETASPDNELRGRGALERLRIRVSPYFLRRTKEEVAKELPDKIEIDEWLDLSDDQAALYSGMVRAGLTEHERIQEKQGEGAGTMHLLTLLLRLRQACVDPGLLDLETEKAPSSTKIERLLEILEERSENSGKTLIFSQFARNLRRIEDRIGQRYGRVFRLDGETRNRQELVDRFQQEPGAAVFLISLKAGGYGLNLTAADTVVHMDPWWNPAVEAQATDRAHRIGQTRPVTVYRLLTRGTVEERVRRMQEHKKAVIEAATGETETPRNWTRGELEDLLR